MSKSSREVIKLLENDGCVLSHIRGSHHIYKKKGSYLLPCLILEEICHQEPTMQF